MRWRRAVTGPACIPWAWPGIFTSHCRGGAAAVASCPSQPRVRRAAGGQSAVQAPSGSGRALASPGSPCSPWRANVTPIVSEKELEEEEGECWSSPFWHVPPATHSWTHRKDAHYPPWATGVYETLYENRNFHSIRCPDFSLFSPQDGPRETAEAWPVMTRSPMEAAVTDAAGQKRRPEGTRHPVRTQIWKCGWNGDAPRKPSCTEMGRIRSRK